MAIITVAREVAAFGEEVAREFARIAGYRYVDREALERGLEARGVDPAKVARFDERRPGFWAAVSRDREEYVRSLRLVMYSEAREGNAVLVGRGATCVFRSVPSAVAVKFVAPVETRVERVSRSYSCDARRASKTVERSDHDRAGFHRYFFDVDWKDPSCYDIVLNSGTHAVETLAEALASWVGRVVSPELELEGKSRVAELATASGIENAVLAERGIPIDFLEVDLRDGVATLSGVARSHAVSDAAAEVARSFEGVREVENDIQIAEDYPPIP